MMTNKMMKNANVNPGATTKAKPASVLPQITYKPTPIDRLKAWWKEHFGTEQARKETAKAVSRSIDHAISSFSRAMTFNLVLALLAMLVVEFCPNIADKCPVFFQLCEGILVFYEFLLKVAFTLLKAFVQLFTLNWPSAADSLSAMLTEGGRLLTELFNWVQSITF
jgi:hypothetical protein